jgi:hypothetical protein
MMSQLSRLLKAAVARLSHQERGIPFENSRRQSFLHSEAQAERLWQ